MATILDQILNVKKTELERHQREKPLAALERRIAELPLALNFSGCIWGPGVRLIAEVKKASPSRGLLLADFDPVALASTYADNGAAAISVLTEVDHFQGSLEHLRKVSDTVHGQGVAVLRKDFLFGREQGASASQSASEPDDSSAALSSRIKSWASWARRRSTGI